MRRVRLWAGLWAVTLLLATSLIGAGAQELADASRALASPVKESGLFGTREIFSADNSDFVKWNGMLARFHEEQARATALCPPGGSGGCEPVEWRLLLDEAKALDVRTRIQRINRAVNRYPYVPSARNWGESNHWETPFEFFAKSGQCQDYAIAKYLLLRASGVPAEQLRLVVLRDTRLGVDHAVTVVYVDGETVLLDNQLAEAQPVRSVHHYQPYYSINEQGWWLHRGPNARYLAASDEAH
jgi:predicted transglutaminase-like cysteine proteinase